MHQVYRIMLREAGLYLLWKKIYNRFAKSRYRRYNMNHPIFSDKNLKEDFNYKSEIFYLIQKDIKKPSVSKKPMFLVIGTDPMTQKPIAQDKTIDLTFFENVDNVTLANIKNNVVLYKLYINKEYLDFIKDQAGTNLFEMISIQRWYNLVLNEFLTSIRYV